MSTATATPPPAPHAIAPPPSQVERLVDTRVKATATQLKTVELAGSIMFLSAAAIGLMLVLALVDHWVAPLPVWGRVAGFLVLVGGSAWFVTIRVLPLLIRRINPVFAARVIERSEPSLKNSLINFLLFRSHRHEVRPVVYQALEEQAGKNVAGVSVETAVDRGHVIRVGYVLAALIILFALYLVLAPKSPLQTVHRVLAPWADVAPPSRVEIEGIEPGDCEVTQGDSLTVTATVRGLRTDDSVEIVYSTVDEAVLDRRIAMRRRGEVGPAVFTATIAPPGGIQQDVLYRVEAGDAGSSQFLAEVRPAPKMLVTSLAYHYPPYTRQAAKTVKDTSDIRAVTGTRVTIQASANLPITEAWAELIQPAPGDGGKAATSKSLRRSMRVARDSDQRKAFATLTLALDEKTGQSKWTGYRVRFRTADGRKNAVPAEHLIETLPDLPPEIELLQPEKREIELPVNRRQVIEVRAVDPDFGLSAVRVFGAAGGTQTLRETLLEDRDGFVGQLVRRLDVVPRKIGLSPGDTLEVWAVAEDNRRDVNDAPVPNMAATEHCLIHIIKPDPTRQTPGVEPEAGADGQQNNDGAREPQPDGGEGEMNDPPPGEQPHDSPQPSDGQEGGGSQQNPGEQGAGDKSGEQGDSDASESKQGESGSADSKSGKSGESGGQSDGGAGASEGEASDGSTKGASPDGNATGAEQPSGQGQTTEAGASGEQGAGSGEHGASSGQQGSPEDSGGQPGAGEPTPLDGSRDGDIIERLNQHQEESGGSQESGSPRSKEQNPGQNPQETAGAGEGEAANPQQSPQAGEESGGGAGEKQPDQEQSGESGGGGQQSQEKPGGQPPGGQSGSPQGGAKPGEEKKPGGGESGEQQPQPGGQGDNNKAGAGSESENNGGNPQSQEGNQQRPGSMKGEQQNKPGGGEQEGKSPATNKKGSDSQGGESGDRKGGGSSGGGQQSKQQGNDSAGSSSPGEDGGAPAAEQGDGPTGEKAGGGEVSDKPTGHQGGMEGAGSASRPSETGERPGEGGGHATGDPAADSEHQENAPTEGPKPAGQSPRGGQGGLERGEGNPIGGGDPTPLDGEAPADDAGESAADKANLEYARQATGLALEHLDHLGDDETRELFGRSKSEMQAWADRYREMMRDAESPEAAETQEELDAALRSLGLAPDAGRTTSGGAVRNDRQTGDRQTGRSDPPAAYRELFDAFRRGGE